MSSTHTISSACQSERKNVQGKNTQWSKRFWRRKKILKPAQQLKLAFFVVLFLLVYSLVFGIATYYPLTVELEEATHFEDRARVASVILGVEKTVWPALVFVLVLAFIGAILFSHRIVGPIYRFERAVDKFLTGNFEPIQLRKTDELKEIETNVNKLADYLKNVKCSDSHFRMELREKLSTISACLNDEGISNNEKALGIVGDLISKLDSNSDAFTAYRKSI